MKALMSVGALAGVIGLLLLVGMIFDIVPSNTVRLVEGYMPMQMLIELTGLRRRICWIELHDELDGHGRSAFLAGHRFLGVHPAVSEVSRLSSDSVQCARHVRDRVARRRLHVGVCQ